jgi:hypothetical protein
VNSDLHVVLDDWAFIAVTGSERTLQSLTDLVMKRLENTQYGVSSYEPLLDVSEKSLPKFSVMIQILIGLSPEFQA